MPASAATPLQSYCLRIHQEAKQALKQLPDAEAIHQIRLCTKRLRAAWQLLQSQDPIQCRQRQRQLSQVARQFSAQRDLSVHQQWLRTLCPEALELLPESPDNPKLSPIELSALSLQLKLDRKAWSDILPCELSIGMDATRSKGRRLCRALSQQSAPPLFHRLRKWSKYLQYQFEVVEHRDEPLIALSKQLGQKHDLDLLIDWLLQQQKTATKRIQVLDQRLTKEGEARSKKQRKRRERRALQKGQLRLIKKALRACQKEEAKLRRQTCRLARAYYQIKSSPKKA